MRRRVVQLVVAALSVVACGGAPRVWQATTNAATVRAELDSRVPVGTERARVIEFCRNEGFQCQGSSDVLTCTTSGVRTALLVEGTWTLSFTFGPDERLRRVDAAHTIRAP